MKIQRFMLLILLLGCCAVSAQTTNALTNTNTPSSSRHLTEVQVLALAKPVLGDGSAGAYVFKTRADFTNGIWKVSTDFEYLTSRPNQIAGRIVTILDSDGTILGTTTIPGGSTYLAPTNRDSKVVQGNPRSQGGPF